MASVALVLALVPLRKFPTHLKIFQWKYHLQDENGLALSRMKFQACDVTLDLGNLAVRRSLASLAASRACSIISSADSSSVTSPILPDLYIQMSTEKAIEYGPNFIELSTTKFCLPEQGYQSSNSVTYIVCDWYATHFS